MNAYKQNSFFHHTWKSSDFSIIVKNTMLRVPRITVLLLTASLFVAGCNQTTPALKETPESVKVEIKTKAPEEAPRTTLPSPSKEIKEEQPQPVVPVPPAIGYAEAIRQLEALFQPNLQPLIIDQQFPLLLHDLNADGQAEGITLGIPQDDAPEEISVLSDYSRLFDDGEAAIDFYLLIFRSQQGYFVRARTIELGKWKVYESMRKMRLDKRRTSPIMIIVSFQTLEGWERQILVFDDASGKPLYRTTVKDTLSVQTRLEDIDADGLVDMLLQEKGMEEGTGYETFLTWKKWDGTMFKEAGTTNVVRNLNQFLANLKSQLLGGLVDQFISSSLDQDLTDRLTDLGYSNTEILIQVLGLQEIEPEQISAIREVIIPEILEYPFTLLDETGYQFSLTFRIVDKSGVSYLAHSSLYMLRNPFGEKQFILRPKSYD